jgi:hypothetical protein
VTEFVFGIPDGDAFIEPARSDALGKRGHLFEWVKNLDGEPVARKPGGDQRDRQNKSKQTKQLKRLESQWVRAVRQTDENWGFLENMNMTDN